ncbi:3-hydroxyacyl-CoA dehydrogenase family protein [Variovorax sp. LT1R16]|uniref:3-hydroxyacyl-CoA dehydrogenase family protein n=1 Tax=Variovorax sp. LT1R16 TaxID=3443728 RepID=UPI003F47B042
MTDGVVIVGFGLMGADIAAIFANASWQVRCVEPHREVWIKGLARSASSVAQLGGNLNPEAVQPCASLEEIDWTAVRLVVECAPEQLELKQALFTQLDRLVPPHISIGSNSSGLPISAIASGCTTAERMANSHFFLPAHLVPLVELAKGKETSTETIGKLRDIFTLVGRVPVQINEDLPGFLANRIQHALMREAFSLIDRGLATPEDVDAAVRYGFGFRYVAAGPIMQKELAGLETQLAAAAAIYPSLCNEATPSRGLAEHVAAGRFGAKTLQGYWSWTESSVAETKARYEDKLIAGARLLDTDPRPGIGKH